jgi:hypothetical protein
VSAVAPGAGTIHPDAVAGANRLTGRASDLCSQEIGPLPVASLNGFVSRRDWIAGGQGNAFLAGDLAQ